MVEANLVEMGTGTRATHKFGKTEYQYTLKRRFSYDTSPWPDFPHRAVVNRIIRVEGLGFRV